MLFRPLHGYGIFVRNEQSLNEGGNALETGEYIRVLCTFTENASTTNHHIPIIHFPTFHILPFPTLIQQLHRLRHSFAIYHHAFPHSQHLDRDRNYDSHLPVSLSSPFPLFPS